jgi:DNA polymerase IV (DinB-like DNA polymerase)
LKPFTSPKTEGRKRIIFHVDMDQFYAAVEEREHPEIKGKPVVVGAAPKGGSGRGVVSTSNYEARRYGVHSGMPISRAWKLCPEAIYLQPHYQLYIETSSRIMDILHEYADSFEQWGLDEAFLDVSTKVGSFEEAKKMAETIKREIYEKERLTCSIGVGPNKLIAKVASDFKKPNGLTVVEEGEVEDFLAPQRVRRLLWVGKKTERRFNKMGIKTIGDLATYDVSVLTEKFGTMGAQYYLSAHGIDNSEVCERDEVKSIGRETTFEEDTADSSIILQALERLCGEIIEELMESKLLYKTVTIKIRYENFETHTHGKTLRLYADSLQSLRKTARELLQPYFSRNRKVRLIGARVSNFASRKKQKTLGQ